MRQTALKPIVTTTLLSVAAVLLWLFGVGDPCLGTDFYNQWARTNPPVVAPAAKADSRDYVDVENPYGIETCHHWPTPAEQALNVSLFAIVAMAIGWLAARRIPHRPLLAAATITTVAMLIALSLQYWARWIRVESIASGEGLEFLRFELLAVLVFFLMAAGFAILGAWVTTRSTRRA